MCFFSISSVAKAEETLTLLAAADNARSAIDNRLKETLFALEVANSEIIQKKQSIEKLETGEKQILAELDKSNLSLAAAFVVSSPVIALLAAIIIFALA